MLRITISIVLLSFFVNAFAYEKRDLLEKKASLNDVRSSIVNKSNWITYPAYSDRKGWDALTGSIKENLIKDGESYLGYTWKVVTATNYLEYERSGSRTAMENPFGANNTALSSLVFAELAEGKGRFLDQIINGVWHSCEMTSWALSAHLPVQKSKRSLPDYREQIIDLTSGDMGSFLSWTWYFLHDEMDKVNPVISQRLYQTIRERILEPYMQRSDFWWQAFNYKPGIMVNNWNPWCNFNVLTCFLLLEENPDKRAEAVYRTMQSVDQFINYVKEDGACEEGPSYWGHAAGKLYDYLQLLSNASGGRINIFDEPMIRNMGEYIARSYVGNGWVVNFADASAKGGGEAGVIYRYGKAVNSTEMQSFAAHLLKASSSNAEINANRDFFRTIENILTYPELSNAKPSLPDAAYSWYPQTQFCYMRNKAGFFFAAKAGFNNESHNHNDVGTFSLYVDTLPVFIDAGVGTYTKQTFSSERYSIWTMQSNYHNLPMINGQPQQFGEAFRASDVAFDLKKNQFSLNMAGAYSKEVAVKKWERTYVLGQEQLVIDDVFELSETKSPNQLNFMTWAKPDLTTPGLILLKKEGRSVKMTFNSNQFTATVETIQQTDQRLSRVWGKELYRIVLLAKQMQPKGHYRFIITKN